MLVPGFLDLPAFRNVDMSFTMDIGNDDGSNIDLSGHTFKMSIATAFGATPFLTLTSSPAAGLVWTAPRSLAIMVQETQWAALAPAPAQPGDDLTCVYDLRANRTSDSYSFLLATGYIILGYGVTPP